MHCCSRAKLLNPLLNHSDFFKNTSESVNYSGTRQESVSDLAASREIPIAVPMTGVNSGSAYTGHRFLLSFGSLVWVTARVNTPRITCRQVDLLIPVKWIADSEDAQGGVCTLAPLWVSPKGWKPASTNTDTLVDKTWSSPNPDFKSPPPWTFSNPKAGSALCTQDRWTHKVSKVITALKASSWVSRVVRSGHVTTSHLQNSSKCQQNMWCTCPDHFSGNRVKGTFEAEVTLFFYYKYYFKSEQFFLKKLK